MSSAEERLPRRARAPRAAARCPAARACRRRAAAPPREGTRGSGRGTRASAVASALMPWRANASATMLVSVRPARSIAVERVGDAEHVVECAVHRALAGAAGEHERAVDIEQDELLIMHGRRARCEGRSTIQAFRDGRLHMRQVEICSAVVAGGGVSLTAQSRRAASSPVTMSMTPVALPKPRPTSPARASLARRPSTKSSMETASVVHVQLTASGLKPGPARRPPPRCRQVRARPSPQRRRPLRSRPGRATRTLTPIIRSTWATCPTSRSAPMARAS